MTNSRRKGKRGELEAVHLWRRWFPQCRRGTQFRSGAEQPDVYGTPYWIEVKRRKSLKNFNWITWASKAGGDMDKAIDAGDLRDAQHTIIMARADRGEWRVGVFWASWEEAPWFGPWEEFAKWLDTQHTVEITEI